MADTLSITDTYNDLLTTTLRHYMRQLHDNIFNDIPLFWWLNKKGAKRLIDGGYEILTPLMYGKNETVGWYSGYDTLDTTPQEGMTMARSQWKQLAGSVSLSRKEERQNSGEHKLLSLLDSKVMQLEMSLKDEINDALFAGLEGSTYATAFGDSDDAVTSLETFMPHAAGANPTSQSANDYGTVCYLSGEAGNQTWWRHSWHYCSGYATTATFAKALAHAYYLASFGSDHPDLVLCNLDAFEQYENNLVSQERFQPAKEAADVGFRTIQYKGASMIFDKAMKGTVTTDDSMVYFINSKNMHLIVDKQTDFINTPFYRPPGQDARTSQILWMGNLVCNNRRRLASLQITA